MKSGLALYMLLSFVGMAGFGFLAMSPQGDMHGCIAALTRGGECPAGSDNFASVAFHAGAIKGFSTATAATGFLVTLLLFVVLSAVFAHTNEENAAVPFAAAYSQYKQEVRVFASALWQRVQRWFSLHENSPAVL
jgi:Na+/H+-translocating membrane pyrophosphatase